MKSVFLIAFVILIKLNAIAQIGWTKEHIIEKWGNDYNSGIADDGSVYIFYRKSIFTQASGDFIQTTAMYFYTNNNQQVCNSWIIIEPATEANGNITYYRSKFVEIGNLRWKDYARDLVYDITISDEFCMTKVWYESSNK